jgi:hypothetical protein
MPLPKQYSGLGIGKDVFSNSNICRPPSNSIAFELELIVHDNSAHDRLNRTRSEKSSWTSLPPKSKMHIRRADADEAGCRRWGLWRPILLSLFLSNVPVGDHVGWCEGLPICWILAPPESVKDGWIRHKGWIFANGTRWEADVYSLGEVEAV